jgi:hypothetical protein
VFSYNYILEMPTGRNFPSRPVPSQKNFIPSRPVPRQPHPVPSRPVRHIGCVVPSRPVLSRQLKKFPKVLGAAQIIIKTSLLLHLSNFATIANFISSDCWFLGLTKLCSVYLLACKYQLSSCNKSLITLCVVRTTYTYMYVYQGQRSELLFATF